MHSMDIEQVCLAMGEAWPGLAQQNLGDWLLRYGGGYSGRANSALPVGEPGMPLEEAVDAVETAYFSRGLSSRFQMPLRLGSNATATLDAGARPLREDLDALLAQRGYDIITPTVIQVIGPDCDAMVSTELAGERHGTRVTWDDAPTPGWESLCSPTYFAHEAAVAVTTACPARYLTLWEGAEPVARARVARAGSWYLLSDLFLVERLRGRSLGRVLMAEMMREGRRLGAERGVLQVLGHNAVAMRLYRFLGWQDLGAYHYRMLNKA